MVLNHFITSFHIACVIIKQPAKINLDIDGYGAIVCERVRAVDLQAVLKGWVLDDPPLTRVSSTSINLTLVVINLKLWGYLPQESTLSQWCSLAQYNDLLLEVLLPSLPTISDSTRECKIHITTHRLVTYLSGDELWNVELIPNHKSNY